MVKECAGDRKFLFHTPAPGPHQIAAAFPEIQVGQKFKEGFTTSMTNLENLLATLSRK
jgi:hypothetical protein